MKRLLELKEAIEAADRFIRRAELVVDEIDAAPVVEGRRGKFRSYNGGKNHAAMKRAALDLAKSLPPLQRRIL